MNTLLRLLPARPSATVPARPAPSRVARGALGLGLAGVLLASLSAKAQTLEWATSYNGISTSALEQAEGVVVDASGNVFVAGLSGGNNGSTIALLRLNPSGQIQWTRLESQPSLGGGMWGRTPLAFDPAGNLVVTGAQFTPDRSDWDPLLLRYSPAGTLLSRSVHDFGPFASFDAVAVAADGSLLVLAHSNPNNGNPHVVRTVKLAADGAVQWATAYAPPIFYGTLGGIAATPAGVCTAAGSRVTLRHPATGDILWQKDLLMPNGGSAVATDSAGNFFVISQSSGVLKLDPAGNLLATFPAVPPQASDLDLDAAGNLYVVGGTLGGKNTGSDILTQKYSPSGTRLWSVTHGKTGGYSDSGLALTVRDGRVYVAGSKYNKTLDLCALKYQAGN